MRGRNTTLRYLAVARKLSGAVAQGRFIGGCHLVGPEAGASCIWPIAHAHCASASTFDVYTRLPTHQSGIKNCASNFSAGQSPPEFTPRASETALGPHLHRLVVIALGFFFFFSFSCLHSMRQHPGYVVRAPCTESPGPFSVSNAVDVTQRSLAC